MRIDAYAKINLTLEILGRRGDGYHEVKTILQTIDLSDRLDILPSVRLRVSCDDPSLEGDANLVWHAATKLAEHAGIQPRAQILIRKRIPVGMGLGGGSSDAAAALVGLNRMWALGLPYDQLSPIAAELGSDVPFFLRGGTALAEGRGERVHALPALAQLPLLLVFPDETIPEKTRRLYSQITPAHYSDGGVTRGVVQTMMEGRLVESGLRNVFEEVAFGAFPGLDSLYRLLAHNVTGRPHLSGAGPALFCIPSNEQEHQKTVQALRGQPAFALLVRAIMPRPWAEE